MAILLELYQLNQSVFYNQAGIDCIAFYVKLAGHPQAVDIM